MIFILFIIIPIWANQMQGLFVMQCSYITIHKMLLNMWIWPYGSVKFPPCFLGLLKKNKDGDSWGYRAGDYRITWNLSHLTPLVLTNSKLNINNNKNLKKEEEEKLT